MKRCPFCPCEFETEEDYKLHMQAFGWLLEQHRDRFQRVHRRAEYEGDLNG